MFTLAQLIDPVKQHTFISENWERRPLVIERNDRKYYSDLLSLANVDHIISSTNLRHPDFRLAKNGKPIPSQDVTLPNQYTEGVADIDKVFFEYRNGATIILEGLHRSWKPLTLFCSDLEKQLSHPVQTNVYLTPKGSQGFAPHYDTHDVFVLQIHGAKHWRIYEAPVHLPDRNMPHNIDRSKLGRPTHEIDLHAGDLIYLPRGYVHEALTSSQESLHITVGVISYTWIDVFNELVAICRQNPMFRESLPLGFAEQDEVDAGTRKKFIELMKIFSHDVDLTQAIDNISEKFVRSRRILPDNYLNNMEVFEHVTLESMIKRGESLIFRISADNDQVRLSFAGKTILFPLFVEPSLRAISRSDKIRVKDIPGELDDQSKLVLVRSLLREGFITCEK